MTHMSRNASQLWGTITSNFL